MSGRAHPANAGFTRTKRAARRATWVGAIAILVWAAQASLIKASGAVPPFQMVAMAFAIAALFATAHTLYNGKSPLALARQPLGAWAVAVGGLLGYHALVFTALKTAPAVEANLLNYLWPLLIVLLSALLPGERLRWWHVAGAVLGLVGTVLILTGGEPSFDFARGAWPGYLAAFGAALAWSAYSVLNRRYEHIPTAAVGPFLWVSAVLALAVHIGVETTIIPTDPRVWAAIVALGLGPTGGVFFAWDFGVKHGDIRVLGGLAYTTPLTSTLLLVALGQGSLSPASAVAGALIVAGAVLAAKELFHTRGVRRMRP